MNNNIDSLFKKTFQETAAEPPAHIWDHIREELDARRKRKKIGGWWYSSAAGLILLFGLTWLLARKEQPMTLLFKNEIIRNEFPSFVPEDTKLAVILSSRPEIPVSNPFIKTNKKRDFCTPVRTSAWSSENAISLPLSYASLKQPPIRTGFIPLINRESYVNRKLYRDLLLAGTKQETKKVKQKRTISLSGHFAPGYASGSYTEPDRISRSSGNISDRMEGIFSMSGGMKVAVSTGKRFSVQTGIIYTQMGQQTKGDGAFMPKTSLLSATSLSQPQDISSPLGNIRTQSNLRSVYYASNSVSSGSGHIEQLFGALEIPLCLKYRLNDNKIKFSISGGFSGSFIINNKAYMNYGNRQEYLGTTEDIRTFNVSTDWALGMEYPVTSRIRIMVEPGFRYYLQSISKDNTIDFKPYVFSFSTGIGIDF